MTGPTRNRSELLGHPRVRAAALAVGSLGVVVAVLVGVPSLREVLVAADVTTVALVAGVAVTVLVLRGLALRSLLGILGHRAPVGRVLGAYAATTVVSTAMPGGQAGGAPVNGLLVARSSDAAYEDGLAATVSLSLLNNLVVVVVGLVGVGYLVAATPSSGGLARLAAGGVGLVGLAVVVGVVLWRVRDRATTVAVVTLTRGMRAVAVVPRVSAPDRAAVERRMARLGEAFGRLRAGSPWRVAGLVVLLVLAHALTVVALWLSFVAVGQPVSAAVLVAVIPAAIAAAVVPTPGGAGGVDLALVALVTSATPAVAPVAGAAVLVYRTATSGPSLLIGGVVVVLLSLGLLRDADALG